MFTQTERAAMVNIPVWAERAIEALRSHGVHVVTASPPHNAGHDLAAELTVHDETRTYAVELKESVSTAVLSALRSRWRGPTLLLAPYVTPSQSERCRHLGIPYADSVGNILLDWDTVLIDVEGRRPTKENRPSVHTKPLRSFRPSGIQVLFCLLSDTEMVNRTVRDIAAASQVSLGSVSRVMAELVQLHHLEVYGGQRRLHRNKELFDRWVEAYALNLYPSLALGEYEGENVHTHLVPETPIEQFGAQWGGESAAALRERYLRPQMLVLYASEVPGKLLSSWRLRKVDTNGNVLLRRRFWADFSFSGRIVPSTLIYADLVASGDSRQIEAAHELRESNALLRDIDSR